MSIVPNDDTVTRHPAGHDRHFGWFFNTLWNLFYPSYGRKDYHQLNNNQARPNYNFLFSVHSLAFSYISSLFALAFDFDLHPAALFFTRAFHFALFYRFSGQYQAHRQKRRDQGVFPKIHTLALCGKHENDYYPGPHNV
jgi:hypothetical protein